MIHEPLYAWAARQIAGTQELWAQLHIGDPGDGGLLGGAVEDRRQPTGWLAGDIAVLTSVQLLRWDNVKGIPGYPQRITHLSFWTAPSDGECWLSSPVTPINVPHGATLEIPPGIRVRL